MWLGTAGVDEALGQWEQGHRMETTRELATGAHAHLTLMGLVDLVFSPYLARTGLGRWPLYMVAAWILAGALLLPAGLVISSWAHGPRHILSLAGGAIFLLGLAAAVWGYAVAGGGD